MITICKHWKRHTLFSFLFEGLSACQGTTLVEETEKQFEKEFKEAFGTPEDEQKAAAALAHAEAQVRLFY